MWPARLARLTRLAATILMLGCLTGPAPTSPAADVDHTPPPNGPAVTPVPDDTRRDLGLSTFYRQHIAVGPLSIVASPKVSEPALREAAWIVRHMMAGREDLLEAMASNRTRLAVMAGAEYTTDIPEHRHLVPRVFWDRRARGLGATPDAPAVSCGEENLLGFPNDPYATENILIHEFAHAVHAMGLSKVDPTFDQRLRAAHTNAVQRGLWKDTYAASNPEEYWAEAVQSWFDDNRENDSLHNHVNTRSELEAYDPTIARLCAEVFGRRDWRYRRPALRPPQERLHLAGWTPERNPAFRWREEPVGPHPHVLVQTTAGDIELELDTRAAPVTVTNFLHYVHAGFYGNGRFFRTVTATNQPTNQVRIAVIQAQADPARTNLFPNPIPLERTRDSGLRHLDGTVSMARAEPDSAQDHFFICIGNQPELDFGGRRNPDGQGFAAFGRVVKGSDTVRRIHHAPADGQLLHQPVLIQRAVRLD